MTRFTSDASASYLRRALDTAKQQLSDIRTLAIINADGTLLASTLLASVPNDAFVESITMLTIAKHLLNVCDGGALDQVFVRGANGYVIVIEMNATTVLVASAVSQVKLALMLMDLKRLANDLALLLEQIQQ